MRNTSNDGEKPHALVIPAVPLVIPAEAGIQVTVRMSWIPAFAGMTDSHYSFSWGQVSPSGSGGENVSSRIVVKPSLRPNAGSEDDHVV